MNVTALTSDEAHSFLHALAGAGMAPKGFEPEFAKRLSDYVVGLEARPEPVNVPERQENILEEANRLTGGNRRADYGHPIDDFTRTGKMWAAILDIDGVTPDQVALCMVALKLSRQVNKPKRDNLVDAAGYARTAEMVIEERARRKELDDKLIERIMQDHKVRVGELHVHLQPEHSVDAVGSLVHVSGTKCASADDPPELESWANEGKGLQR